MIDPADPPTWTGTWRDPRFSPPADGGRPENAHDRHDLHGQLRRTVNLQVPAADGKMRLWRNTSVATLAAGATATLGTGTLGYEWDEDADNGARPAGLIDLSTTNATGVQVLLDYGSTYGAGTRHPPPDALPGAQRRAGLRRGHGPVVLGARQQPRPRFRAPASTPMQQATVNLLADMGAQPATLQSGLTVATKSTDTVAPTASVSRRRPPARPCRSAWP